MISVPVTKVLLEIMFGYKRIKGSGIRLSSQIDWTQVYEEIYAPHPRRPRTPKRKGGDKKKVTKKKPGDRKTPPSTASTSGPEDKRTPLKPRLPMPSGKVVIAKTHVKTEVVTSKPERKAIVRKKKGKDGPEIFEIVPPQYPDGFPEEQSEEEERFPSPVPREPFTPPEDSSTKPTSGPVGSDDALPSISSKQSLQRQNAGPYSSKGSMSALPEVEATGQSSGEQASRKSSVGGEGSKKSSTILPKI